MFSINHIALLLEYLPVSFRTFRTKAFLGSAIAPLEDIWTWFTLFRSDIDYSLKFNGQVIYLEHLLNDQFDPINRTIYISDAANVPFEYIFTTSENVSNYIYSNTETLTTDQVYLMLTNELISQEQFVVNIPNTSINQIELKALVDKYRLASKNYTIIITP